MLPVKIVPRSSGARGSACAQHSGVESAQPDFIPPRRKIAVGQLPMAKRGWCSSGWTSQAAMLGTTATCAAPSFFRTKSAR